jgi:hypothetical protein
MRNAEPPDTLPLQCPHCDHNTAKLFVNSYTVITVQCASCAYTWSVEITAIPEPLRARIPHVKPTRW